MNKKEKNVLVLAMSTFSQLKVNHYCTDIKYRDSQGNNKVAHYRFDGVSQLEAGTKYFINRLAADGKALDKIIILNTKETYGDGAKTQPYNRLEPFLFDSKDLETKLKALGYSKKGQNKEGSNANTKNDAKNNIELSPCQFYMWRILDYLERGEIDVDYKKAVNDNLREIKCINNAEIAKLADGFYASMNDYCNTVVESNSDDNFQLDYVKAGKACKEAFDIVESECIKPLGDTVKYLCRQLIDKYDKADDEETLNAKVDDFQKDYRLFLEKLTQVDKELLKPYINDYYYYNLEKNCKINMSDIVDDKAKKGTVFKSKFSKDNSYNYEMIEELYRGKQDILFDCLSSDKVEFDAMSNQTELMVTDVCASLLSLTHNGDYKINVYVNVQGGARTFMQTVNSAITLLKNRDVELKEIVTTEFGVGKMVIPVVDVTQEYAITNLVSGMDAFVNYGKADELLTYLHKRGLDKYPNAERLIRTIEKIDDSIQTIDVNRFDEAIDELKANNREMLNPDNYTDSNIKIIVADIEREYEPLLKDGCTTPDKVEWLNNKGFTSVALTYIESLMPRYFVTDKKYIKLRSLEALEQAGNPVAEDQRRATCNDIKRKIQGSASYEEFENSVIDRLGKNLNKGPVKEYINKAIRYMFEAYVKHNICQIPDNDARFDKIRDIIFDNQLLKEEQYGEFSVKEFYKTREVLRDKVADTYKKFCEKMGIETYDTFREVALNKDNIWKQSCLAIQQLNLENKAGIKDKIKKLLDAIYNYYHDLYGDKAKYCQIYDSVIKTHFNQNKEIYKDLIISKICDDLYYGKFEKLIKPMDDNDQNHQLERLDTINYIKSEMSVYGGRDDLFDGIDENTPGLKIFEKLVNYYKTNIEPTPNNSIIDFDSIYSNADKTGERTIEQKYDSISSQWNEERNINLNDYFMLKEAEHKYTNGHIIEDRYITLQNYEFFCEKIGGELWKLYVDDNKLLMTEEINGEKYLYKTFAGLKGEDNAIHEASLNAGLVNKRRQLEELLLLHKAIRQERNNTNHASQKIKRLPNKLVKHIIEIYLEKVRELDKALSELATN